MIVFYIEGVLCHPQPFSKLAERLLLENDAFRIFKLWLLQYSSYKTNWHYSAWVKQIFKGTKTAITSIILQWKTRI